MAASISLGIRVRVNNGAAREDRLEVDPLSLDWVQLREHLFSMTSLISRCAYLYLSIYLHR